MLVDILCEIEPQYNKYVVIEGGHKVLDMHIIKAIYGPLVSALLFYKKLAKDLKKDGFVVNPYNPCLAHKMVNGKHMIVFWNVDDFKCD